MRIELGHTPARIALTTGRDAPRAGDAELDYRDAAAARAALLRFGRDDFTMAQLRRLLDDGLHRLAGLSDDAVLDEVATRLAAGRIRASVVALRPGPHVLPPQAGGRGAPAGRGVAASPRGASSAGAAGGTAAVSPPDSLAGVDQDAQAGCLQAAARSGAPFVTFAGRS